VEAAQRQQSPEEVREVIDLGGRSQADAGPDSRRPVRDGQPGGGPGTNGRAASCTLSQPFWMAVTESDQRASMRCLIRNHDTPVQHRHALGWIALCPVHIGQSPRTQTVARVSWSQAMRFCDWLSGKTGLAVTLPTEAQWEWAARAGSDTAVLLRHDGKPTLAASPIWPTRRFRWYKMGYDGPSALQRRSPYPPEMNFPCTTSDSATRGSW